MNSGVGSVATRPSDPTWLAMLVLQSTSRDVFLGSIVGGVACPKEVPVGLPHKSFSIWVRPEYAVAAALSKNRCARAALAAWKQSSIETLALHRATRQSSILVEAASALLAKGHGDAFPFSGFELALGRLTVLEDETLPEILEELLASSLPIGEWDSPPELDFQQIVRDTSGLIARVAELEARLGQKKEECKFLTFQLRQLQDELERRASEHEKVTVVASKPPEPPAIAAVPPAIFLRMPTMLTQLKQILMRRSDIALIRKSDLFDNKWYLETYRDVAAAKVDAARHYVRRGAGEGRDPGPKFSTVHYLNHYPEVFRFAMNPLAHYVRYGREEGRVITPSIQSGNGLASSAKSAS